MCVRLNELIALCRRIHVATPALSEIDTQVLLIEPVLELAGWNVRDVSQTRRASRSARKQRFDIEVGVDAHTNLVNLALECKAVFSPEYNIAKMNTLNGIGGLVRKVKGDGVVWECKRKDGAGQLRAYCAKFPQYTSGQSVPVLTNGEEWVIFNTARFTDESRLAERLTESDIVGHARLDNPDFQQAIIDHLRSPNHNALIGALPTAS